MAPSFDTLSDHDFEDGEDELDFSDLQEQFDVRMEEGLDTFVVCLPSTTALAVIDVFRSLMVFLLLQKIKNPNSLNSYSEN